MMGVPMTPEQSKLVSEKVAERKAKVAASLGKTVEEFDQASHDLAHGHSAQRDEPDPEAAVETDGAAEVDEEAVLAFIRTRQEVIEKQRARIKALEGQVAHLEFQRDLAEKKNAALRDALAKMRAAAKGQQAPAAPDGRPARE